MRRLQWRELLSSAVFRTVAIVLAVVIPLNLLTLVLGNRVMAQAERLVSREAEYVLQLNLRRMDDALERADREFALISMDDADFRRLSDRAIDGDDEYYRQVQSLVELNRTLKTNWEGNSVLSGLFAYFPEKEWFVQTSSGARATQIGELVAAEAAAGRAGEFTGGRPCLADGRGVLLKMRKIRGAWCGAWIELRDLAAQMPAGEAHALALTDGAGRVFYSEAAVPETLDPAADRLRLDGTEYLLLRAGSEASELSAVELLPQSEITGALPFAIRLMQLLSIAAVALLPILMLVIQRWIVSPVSKLTEAMTHVEDGELDWRIESRLQGSEFERINRNFNAMMDQVKALKISVYEEQLKAQKIKMGFLAQQIRPHFILNALNILYSYEPEEYALSRRMILCLSKYFRYVVNAGQDFVPLEREMENIRNYFEIQHARFPRTFRGGTACAEEVRRCPIPPLLLQSFAENAIKHAFAPGEVIDISVSARLTAPGRVGITVSDTGAGISDEVLERIAEFRRTREFRRDLGVGIQNSIDRLDLIYRGAATVEIRRGADRGTVVELELPLTDNREEEEDERDIG